MQNKGNSHIFYSFMDDLDQIDCILICNEHANIQQFKIETNSMVYVQVKERNTNII